MAKRGLSRADRVVAGTVAVLVGYVGLIGLRERTADGTELFPFFKWELFSSVPNRESQDFTIRLLEIDGRVLDEPLYFADAGEHISTAKSPDAVETINRFGEAVRDDRPLVADRQRTLVEGGFLYELGSARYQLVQRRFDLIDRIRCADCFVEERVLAEFEL